MGVQRRVQASTRPLRSLAGRRVFQRATAFVSGLILVVSGRPSELKAGRWITARLVLVPDRFKVWLVDCEQNGEDRGSSRDLHFFSSPWNAVGFKVEAESIDFGAALQIPIRGRQLVSFKPENSTSSTTCLLFSADDAAG